MLHVVLTVGKDAQALITPSDLAHLRNLATRAIRAGVAKPHRKTLPFAPTIHPCGRAGTWQPHVDAFGVAVSATGRAVTFDEAAVLTEWRKLVSSWLNLNVAPQTFTMRARRFQIDPAINPNHITTAQADALFHEAKQLRHAMYRDLRSFPAWSVVLPPRALAARAVGNARPKQFEAEQEQRRQRLGLDAEPEPQPAKPQLFFAELRKSDQLSFMRHRYREHRNLRKTGVSPQEVPDDGSELGEKCHGFAGPSEAAWYTHRSLRVDAQGQRVSDAEVIADYLDPTKATNAHCRSCEFCMAQLKAIRSRNIGQQRASEALYSRLLYLAHVAQEQGWPFAVPLSGLGNPTTARKRLDTLIDALDAAGLGLGNPRLSVRVPGRFDAKRGTYDRLTDWLTVYPDREIFAL